MLVFSGCNRFAEEELSPIKETVPEEQGAETFHVSEIVEMHEISDTEYIEIASTEEESEEEEFLGEEAEELTECTAMEVENIRVENAASEVTTEIDILSADEEKDYVNATPIGMEVPDTGGSEDVVEETEWVDDWGEPDFVIGKGDSAPTTDGEGSGVEIEIDPIP